MQQGKEMRIDTIKTIRKLLTIGMIIVLFLGVQVIPDAHGHKATLWEALLASLLLGAPLFLFWTDWLYYNYLIAKGAKINYNSFQIVGLIIVACMFVWVSAAMYNGYLKL